MRSWEEGAWSIPGHDNLLPPLTLSVSSKGVLSGEVRLVRAVCHSGRSLQWQSRARGRLLTGAGDLERPVGGEATSLL